MAAHGRVAARAGVQAQRRRPVHLCAAGAGQGAAADHRTVRGLGLGSGAVATAIAVLYGGSGSGSTCLAQQPLFIAVTKRAV